MNILSPIPALIASGSDLVERDVTSNIELIQGAQLAIPAVPMKHSMYLLSNGAAQGEQPTSFIYPFFWVGVGVNGGLATQVLRLAKGLWTIEVVGNASNLNFVPVNNVSNQHFSITIGDGGQTTSLLTTQKDGSGSIKAFNFKRTFMVNGFFPVVFGVGATAIGETSIVDCVLTGNRYL